MQQFHTWGGKYFGCKENDDLWTYKGKHIGKFYGDEIYGKDGKYLGELRNERLITNIAKKNYRKTLFTPFMNRVGLVPLVNLVGFVMLVGHEDFPPPEAF